ncbi:MAG TPA: DNA-directed RNA polymerase subunit beta', partial [Patescibacteria group bacterium]|nr:DNA-directed RNA polymerase subunit beta' [Patescibacteria group bacterium]
MKYLNELKNFDAIKIYLASPEEMLSWSFGEVTKPETINYRTFKAEKDGLFDEKIFGPVKNYECYCGKYKGIRYKGVICDKCGVEVTHSRVRRERMGHINLASPVAHVWFFRGIPSKMALLLEISPRSIESVIYFSSFIVTQLDNTKKARAISEVDKDLEKSKKLIEKERDDQIRDMEKEVEKLSRKHNDLVAQEEVLKLKQKIQTLITAYERKMEDQEKTFRLIQRKIESIELFTVLSDNEYINLANYIDMFTRVDIGAEAIKGILEAIDLNALASQLREELEGAKGQKASKLAKRLKVVEQFRRAGVNPARMILEVIPVIPPDLRPLVQLEGGRFASSDLNELYRRLINRNNRLKRLLDLGAPEIIVRNEKRMLQESVDALFDSSKQRQRTRVTRGKKELRSLADMLKGKQGIFRLNLLGKRVDYSGRAVIINGPTLKLNECGLPKEMALELFKPFVLREILSRGYAPNVKSARFFLDNRSSEVWDILEDLVKDHPVMLNRAPTLWRLGIQAFYPKLIEGNSIRLHLAVTTGFNADFDGDQMAVHLPLSEAAKDDARTRMISTNNLLNPSDSSPMSVPTKIMLFGTYYMTSVDENYPVLEKVFSDKEELLYYYNVYRRERIFLRQRVKVRINGEVIETTPGRVLFNEMIPENFGYINKEMTKSGIKALLAQAFEQEPNEVIVKLIDDLKDLGLKYGTKSGQSVALSDIKVPEQRDKLVEKGREAIRDIDKNFRRGLITKTEAQRLTEDAWNQVTAEIDQAVWDSLPEDNPVKVLVKSGSTRASRDQVKQIAGVKGLISDPTGKIVQLPILGNYKTGLSGLEYFVSARGARKGLVDKGLKTADAGYLTRRLVDVAQDVLVREEDCTTNKGREVRVDETTVLQKFSDRVLGRYLAQDVKKGNKIVVKSGTLLTNKEVDQIVDTGVERIIVRSPMTCETRRGICQKCYGVDLVTRKEVKIGTAAGVAAAQSIGEPGTQLTLRTFHTGGIAGKDITQGLPRVEEIVEARAPKYLSIMTEITGKVKISVSGDERKVTIIATDKTEDMQTVEYMVDPIAEIIVQDDQLVAKGEKLTAGHLDLTDLLRTVGVEETKRYIINEVQKVYSSQGVSLNDKHVEVIVRQMFNNVRIEDRGDTEFLVGEIVTKAAFEEENERVLAAGGMPASAKVQLLGITKSSLNTDSFLSA